MRLSPTALLVAADRFRQFEVRRRRSEQASKTSAVVGGLSGGGLVAFSAGALLGPPVLLGGALVGWKLASFMAGARRLEQARSTIETRLDEIAAALLREVDRQVEPAVSTVRSAVHRRRRAFAADLYGQFEVVQAISS